jgi:enoyl-CoA hydratase/carnithine racemase
LNSSPHDLRFFRVEQDGAAAVCLLDKPPANALDEELHEDMARLLDRLEEDASIRAVVLGSAHETIFMAGARLREFPDEHFGAAATAHRVDLAQSTFGRVQRLAKPVIAAIAGHALGGGCELALACDFRLMADGDALIGLPEIRLGIIPGGGGTQRLPRLVGRARATRMLLLGERLRAPEAAAAGLVDEVYPDAAALLAGARALAARLAAMPAPGVRLIKQCLNDGYDPSLAHGLEVERAAAIEALAQPEAREGLQAFLEKREPRFHG